MPLSSKSAALPPSEIWLRLIAHTLPAYVAYIDADLHYVMVNRKYEEEFSLRAVDIIGRPVPEVLGDSYRNVRGHLEGALAGNPQRFTTRMRTSAGERFLAVTHLPDYDESGAVRGIIVHGVDVTERHRAEEALRRSEERFRILVERASVGINIGNARGELSFMNPALLNLLGYSADEVARGDVRWDQLTPPEYAARDHAALLELQSTGRASLYEKHYRAKDGRLVPLLLGATLIPGVTPEAGEDIAVFLTDLTLQKRSEQALVQNEKLAAVGKLASSISHELNNPLEAVTNLLFLVRQDPSLSEQAREYLEIADRELSRMGQVTSQTLRFHRQSTRAQTIAPEQLTEEVLSLFRPRLENCGIRVFTRYTPDLTVTCYESDIRQVLNNLVGNAIDVMRKSGELLIRTSRATCWADGARGVRITVADTGSGMAPEVAARIFEAFYTTKGIGGTGLGLWISHRIVAKHGGTLRVRTSTHPAHHGTVFSLWLPLELSDNARQPWIAEESAHLF